MKSAINWIDEIPKTWKTEKLKFCLNRNDGGVWGEEDTAGDGKIVLRSTDISEDGSWQIGEPAIRRLTDGEFRTAQLKSGDLLLTKSSGSELHLGKTGLVTKEVEKMGCAFSNFMQRLRPNERVHSKFLFYILNNSIGRDQINYWAMTTSGLVNLSRDLIGLFLIPLAPISQQQKIAAYLDEKTETIDEAIAKKRRQVELLKEKRAAVIGNYVTKGLEKDTTLVDSGNEWLGRIPAHWKMQRLKFFGRFVGGGTPKTDDRSLWEGDIPWVSSKDMKVPYLEDTEDHINMRAVRESATTMLPKGCLLMVFRSGILIHTIPAAVNTREMAINQDLKALMPSYGVSPRYLMYVILGFQQELLALWRKEGATVESLDLRQVTDTAFPLPSKEEQEAIADVLEAKTAVIDKAVAHIETSIELLTEYKSSLITNVVTGKVAV